MLGFVEIINDQSEWPSTFYLLGSYGGLYIRDRDRLLRKKNQSINALPRVEVCL